MNKILLNIHHQNSCSLISDFLSYPHMVWMKMRYQDVIYTVDLDKMQVYENIQGEDAIGSQQKTDG